MIDERTEFGARVAWHLREETVVWLTTVTPSVRRSHGRWDSCGTAARTSPVQPARARIRNIGRNPKVTLNFRGDPNGGDIVVLSATAEVSTGPE